MNTIFTLFNKKVKESRKRIEAKFYERYDETNTPGIYLSETEIKTVEKAVDVVKRIELKKLLQADRDALNELLNSEGWQVFLKYADGMTFDIPSDCTLIERLAIEKAKEQAVNAIVSIPNCIVSYYDNEMIGED